MLAMGSNADPQLLPLTTYDTKLAKALSTGCIKLLDASALRHGKILANDAQPEFVRRQELEERERAGTDFFLAPAAAAAALRAADRRICFLTHAWRATNHPDPDGATLAALLRFLRSPLGTHVVAVFVDVACLHQHPRSAEQETTFQEALKVLPKGFASPLGTTVLRFAYVPPCPATVPAENYDGRPFSRRGWCVLQSAASEEVAARLADVPEQLAAKLVKRPAKLVEIGDDCGSDEPRVVKGVAAEQGAGARAERIRGALGDEAKTQFTRRHDRAVAVRVFSEIVTQISNAVTEAAVPPTPRR
jgi:hypothetical protein